MRNKKLKLIVPILLALLVVGSGTYYLLNTPDSDEIPPTLEVDTDMAFIGSGTYLKFTADDVERTRYSSPTYKIEKGVRILYSDQDITVSEILKHVKADLNLKLLFANYENSNKRFAVYPKGQYKNTYVLSDSEILDYVVEANKPFYLIGSKDFEVFGILPFTIQPLGQGFTNLNLLDSGWSLLEFSDLQTLYTKCSNRISSLWLSNLKFFDNFGNEISRTITSQLDKSDLISEDTFVKYDDLAFRTGWAGWINLIGNAGTCIPTTYKYSGQEPLPVTGLQATALNNGFQLVWDAVPESYGNATTGYVIAYGKTTGGGDINNFERYIETGLVTAYTVDNPNTIKAGERYYISIYAINDLGNYSRSAPEAVVTISVPETPVTPDNPETPAQVFYPDKVSGVSALGMDSSIKVNWTKVSDTNDLKIKGYKIYWGSNSNNYTHEVSVGNVDNFTLVGLINLRTYFLSIVAIGENNLASRDYSNEVTAQPFKTRPVVVVTPPVCTSFLQIVNNNKGLCDYKFNGSTEFNITTCDANFATESNQGIYGYAHYCSINNYTWIECKASTLNTRNDLTNLVCDRYTDSNTGFAWKRCIPSRQGVQVGEFVCDSGVWTKCGSSNFSIGNLECKNGAWVTKLEGELTQGELTQADFGDLVYETAQNPTTYLGKLNENATTIFDGARYVECNADNKNNKISDKVCRLISYKNGTNLNMAFVWTPQACSNKIKLNSISTPGNSYTWYQDTICMNKTATTADPQFMVPCETTIQTAGPSLCGFIGFGDTSGNVKQAEICTQTNQFQPSLIYGDKFVCIKDFTTGNLRFISNELAQVYKAFEGILENNYTTDGNFDDKFVCYGGGVTKNTCKESEEWFSCSESNVGEHLRYLRAGGRSHDFYTCLNFQGKYRWYATTNNSDEIYSGDYMDMDNIANYSAHGVIVNYSFREFRNTSNKAQDLPANGVIDESFFNEFWDKYKAGWDKSYFCAGDGNGNWDLKYQCTSYRPTYVCTEDNIGEKIKYFNTSSSNTGIAAYNLYTCAKVSGKLVWKKN